MKLKVKLAILLMLMSLSVLSYAALDLKFSSAISLSPATPKVGDTVAFSVSFKSEGATVTNMKIIGGVDGTQLFERVYASIPADGVRSNTFNWTATPGDHTVFFTLDPAHSAGDFNYGNNHLEKPFTVTGGTSLIWEAGAFVVNPASPNVGETVHFSHRFKVTKGPVDNLKLGMGLVGSIYEMNWPHLDVGASETVGFNFKPLIAASHTVYFQLDPDRTTNDENFEDNRFEYTFTPNSVGPSVAWQDGTFTVNPAIPKFGDEILFKMYYKVDQATVNNLKIIAKLDGDQINEMNIPTMTEGWNRTFAAGWTAMSAGNHTLLFILDPDHTTNDQSFADNTFKYTFNIPDAPPGAAPNFKIGEVTITPVKDKYYCSDKVEISYAFVNDGNKVSNSAQIIVKIHGLVHVTAWTGIMQPGESRVYHFDHSVEGKLFEIKIDPANEIQESNENDNSWSTTIPCKISPRDIMLKHGVIKK